MTSSSVAVPVVGTVSSDRGDWLVVFGGRMSAAVGCSFEPPPQKKVHLHVIACGMVRRVLCFSSVSSRWLSCISHVFVTFVMVLSCCNNVRSSGCWCRGWVFLFSFVSCIYHGVRPSVLVRVSWCVAVVFEWCACAFSSCIGFCVSLGVVVRVVVFCCRLVFLRCG